jgi:hypothetical protein
MARYACPCCGFLTLDELPPDTFITCPVCQWEDDGLQLSVPDLRRGANEVSFYEAKENFRKFGCSDPKRAAGARPPRPEERPPAST